MLWVGSGGWSQIEVGRGCGVGEGKKKIKRKKERKQGETRQHRKISQVEIKS